MSKNPYFPFYSGDFLSGTMFMTDDQVGKYIRLLCAQHQHGHLPEKDMLNICKTYDKDIFSRFVKDSAGNYFNERLENEIIKRKEYSKSRSENRSGKKNICETHVSHMEYENDNNTGSSNLKGDSKGEKPSLPAVISQTFTVDGLEKYFSESEQKNKELCYLFSITPAKLVGYQADFIKKERAKLDDHTAGTWNNRRQALGHFIEWLQKQLKKTTPKTLTEQWLA